MNLKRFIPKQEGWIIFLEIMAAMVIFALTSSAFAADIPVTGADAQQKINASANGDTIIFNNASINSVNLMSNRVYKGTVTGTNANNFTINARGLTKVSIDVTLINANLDISQVTDSLIVVRGRDFVSRPGDAARHCVYFDGLQRTVIRAPEFRNMLNGDTCIFGKGEIHGTVIEDAYFYNVHEGIHLFGTENPDKPALMNQIRRIYIDGIRRHGIELQYVWRSLWLDTIFITGRHDTNRDMDISCATGGPPNIPGNGTTLTSWDVRINNFVCQRATLGTEWWRNCGIEAMGQITITNGYFVNCGQGVLFGAVGPDWAVRNCKFKNTTKPMSGEPIDFTFPPKPENYTGNNENYTGAIPTWEQLLANGGGTPQPPPTGSTMNVTAKAYKTYVDLTLDFTGSVGTVALERRAGDGVWSQLATWPAGQTGTKPFKDSQFSADQIANTWKFWYRLRDKNGSTPEVEVQIGLGADPVPPPVNKGFISTQTIETTFDANNAVVGVPKVATTTRPVQ